MPSLTELLISARGGDASASTRLFELVYAELKRMAHQRLRRIGGEGPLNTTALVHESYLRLSERGQLLPSDRAAFFCYVGRVMRSVVIDHVRERLAHKRGGNEVFVTLTTDIEGETFDDERLLAVNAALDTLEKVPRISPTGRDALLRRPVDARSGRVARHVDAHRRTRVEKGTRLAAAIDGRRLTATR